MTDTNYVRMGKMISYTPYGRASLYNAAFPDRPPLASNEDWVTGTWCIGACYKNPSRMPDGSPFYGGYPRGYLERVHTMFPEAKKILHVFSGGLTLANALVPVNQMLAQWQGHQDVVIPCVDIELVDVKGPEDGRHPTWQGDVTTMPEEWAGRFDLVLADPPYSTADAVEYDVPMPAMRRVMRELRRVTAKAGNLVWLDQKWPMHRKTDWKTWGHIGLVRSTNHRMRLVSMFEAV